MKLLKRSLALLMSLLLCLALVTFSALAEGSEESDNSAETESYLESADSGKISETQGKEPEPVEEQHVDAETAENNYDSEASEPSDVIATEPSDPEEPITTEDASESSNPTEASEEQPTEVTSDPETSDESENASKPDEEPDDNSSVEEKPSTAEQPEAVLLVVDKLKDARIENGQVVFVVKATCNQENGEIQYQWQKLDLTGAFNEIEDEEERAVARENAWEDLDKETGNKLSFEQIESYAEYENLLFRCRVSVGETVIYTEEVKLLPEIVPENPTDASESEPVDVQSEDGEQETPDTEEPEMTEDTEALVPEEDVEDPATEEGVEESLPEEGSEETESEEIVLTEEYVWPEEFTVEEGMIARINGAVAIPENVILTVVGTLSLDEEAALTVLGKLILTEEATVEGDATKITAAEEGEIEGLDRFLPEAETEEFPAMTWEDILAVGIFEAEEPVLIEENVTIPADAVLVIHSGELIVAPEASLIVEGLLIIEGGTLTVSEGAALKNDMFIQVEGTGSLLVEGAYDQAEVAALVWNAANNDSIVEGIDRIMIDKIVYASDEEALAVILSRDGYRTLTVLIPNAELAKVLDRVPNGVIISVR